MDAGPTKQLRVFIFIFGAIFLFFGFMSGPGFLHIQSEIKRMQQWPIIDATVVKADTVTTLSGTGLAHYIQYMQKYTYSYTVKGVSYTNDRQYYGVPPDKWNSESAARSQLLQIGTKIKIHYNPENPADSVIRVLDYTLGENNLTRDAAMIVTVISGLFTIVCAVILLKRHRAERSARMSRFESLR
jgi:hypothetical protein